MKLLLAALIFSNLALAAAKPTAAPDTNESVQPKPSAAPKIPKNKKWKKVKKPSKNVEIQPAPLPKN